MLQGIGLLIRALPICLLVLAWAGTGICRSSTELLDMRLGVHDESSRAVLSCRGPRPQSLGPLSNATYRISFHSLSLPQNWKPSRIPQGSFFSHIEYSEDESAQTIIISISREDLWVEEVVLKKDDRPGEYRLVLDFWPLDPQKAVKRQQANISPQIPSPENTLEELAVIYALPQGKRMPVRTDVVLQADREPKGETVAETSKAQVTGFRVGEHPGYTRIIISISREDLWVEEVVLKKDDRPGEYRLILDFWPLDSQKAVKRQKANISPQIPSPENTLEESAVISALPQGKRMPVRTDVVLQADREPKGETVAETSKAQVTGFRVGEHPGYTRVVVEARGLEPVAIPDVVNGSLRISYEHLELQVPKEIMRKKVRGLLQGVRVESDSICIDVQSGTQTKQAMILDSDPPYPGTYRLVLDLESTTGPIGAGNKDKSFSR